MHRDTELNVQMATVNANETEFPLIAVDHLSIKLDLYLKLLFSIAILFHILNSITYSRGL